MPATSQTRASSQTDASSQNRAASQTRVRVPPPDQDSDLAPHILPPASSGEGQLSTARGESPCLPATNKRSRATKGARAERRNSRATGRPPRATERSPHATKRSPRATKRSTRAGAGALDSVDVMSDLEHVVSDFEHVRSDDTFDSATTPSISPTPSPISPTPSSISPSAASASPTPSYSPTPSTESLVSLIDYSSDSSFSLIVSDDLSSERSLSPSGRASSSSCEPAPSPSEPTPLRSEDVSCQNATLPLSASMWRWRPTTASDEDSPPSNSHHNLADRYGDFASDHDDRSSRHHNLSSTDLSSTNLSSTNLASTRNDLSSNHHDALANNPTDLSSSFSAAFARLSLQDDASDAQAASYAQAAAYTQAMSYAEAASNARSKHPPETVARPYLTAASINAINEWLRSVERSAPLAPLKNPPVSPEYPPEPSEFLPAPSAYPPSPTAYPPASSERPSGAISPLWQAASSVPPRRAAPSDPRRQVAPSDLRRLPTPSEPSRQASSELSRINICRRRLSALRRAAPWREAPLNT